MRHTADLPAAAAIVGRAEGVSGAVSGAVSDGVSVDVDADTRRVSAPVRDRSAALPEVLRALDAAGVAVADIAVRRPSLDEVFLHLTGTRKDARKESAA